MVVPILNTLLIYWGVGYNTTSPKHFFIFMLGSLLQHLVGVSFGLFGGCIFSDMKLAQSVLPNVMLPFMLFAGFFANRKSMSKWISWLEYVSPMKYYYELVMTNEFEDRGLVPNPTQVM